MSHLLLSARAFAVALWVAGAVALPAPSRTEAAPLSSHAMIHTCCTPDAMKERLFAESKAMGASFIRVDVELNGIFEAWGRSAEHPGWQELDEVTALSRRFDLPVLGILMSTPTWLSSCPGAGAEAVKCAPSDMAAFGELAGEVAEHARDTITHWEIVNEPDGAWAFTGSPEQYARMLRAAHDSINARVPEALVVMGGVMWPQYSPWVERVLNEPRADAAHAFDVTNLHLRGAARSLPGHLTAWRGLLARHGFDGPVWVTEHGYASNPAYQTDPGYRGGESAQADYLTESVPALAEAGAAQVFVTLRDNLDGAFSSEGVIEVQGEPGFAVRRKPAFAALRRLVDHWDELVAARADRRRAQDAERTELEQAAEWERGLAPRRARVDKARFALAIQRFVLRRTRDVAERGHLFREIKKTRRRLYRRRTELAWQRRVVELLRLRASLHAQRALELEAFIRGR